MGNWTEILESEFATPMIIWNRIKVYLRVNSIKPTIYYNIILKPHPQERHVLVPMQLQRSK